MSTASQTVMDVANKAVDEKYANVIVSTAHKSKGREWSSVRIAGDFREPVNEDGTPSDPSRLSATWPTSAVTRAKDQLDRGGLAWVDNYIDTPPGGEEHPQGHQRIARERRIKEQQ